MIESRDYWYQWYDVFYKIKVTTFAYGFNKMYASNSTNRHKYLSFIILSDTGLERFMKYCM